MTQEIIDIVLLVALVVAAMATAMTARLLRSVIVLAATSAVLAVIMYRLGAQFAAVFELSVCAGLLPAIFISTIGLTQRVTGEEMAVRLKERLKRYWFLPLIVVAAGIVLIRTHIPLDAVVSATPSKVGVQTMFWNVRQIDLFGQIAVLLAGAFAVVVLMRGLKNES